MLSCVTCLQHFVTEREKAQAAFEAAKAPLNQAVLLILSPLWKRRTQMILEAPKTPEDPRISAAHAERDAQQDILDTVADRARLLSGRANGRLETAIEAIHAHLAERLDRTILPLLPESPTSVERADAWYETESATHQALYQSNLAGYQDIQRRIVDTLMQELLADKHNHS